MFLVSLAVGGQLYKSGGKRIIIVMIAYAVGMKVITPMTAQAVGISQVQQVL